jgi:hypothetical protein
MGRGHRTAHGPGRRPREARRLSLESLEDRTVPSTFTVVDLGDAGVGSGLTGDLRYAIDTANSNADLSNRIVFQPGLTGTITLTQGKLVVSKPLGIFGPGADLSTISGNHQSGVLDIEAPAGQTVFLSDVTIADGTGAGRAELGLPAGGGLFNDAATLVLERTMFSRNTLPFEHWGGGALFNWHGIVTLNDSVIEDTGAGDAPSDAIRNAGTMAIHDSTVSATVTSGGTIINDRTMTLGHCTIADNGGWIANFGSLTMTACAVTGNNGYYGGISNYNRATVTDSTFLNNHSRVWGGAIANIYGNLTISGSTIAGNTAGYGGGGVYADGGQLSMTNSTVSGNVVQFFGGGIYYNSGFLEVTSSTIAFNDTTVHASGLELGGGGVYAEDGRALLRNTIVADNTTAQDEPDVLGSMLSLGYNLIGQTDASSGWVATDRTGTADAPLDPRLGPLQDNGGPTPTHALLAGSPALHAGDPAVLMTLDQRGSVRVGSVGTPTDIGAFEAGQATQFRLLAPASVGAGQPFALTVVALDRWGNVASTYTGTVHLSSTDLFAQLPDDTAFSGDDAGAHTFSITLATPGPQDVRVADTASPFGSGSVAVDVADATPPGRGAGFLADLLCWKRSTWL